jgi:hypothetical protein
MAQVHEAGRVVDRKTAATRPRVRRRRPSNGSQPADQPLVPEEVREQRSLRRVFLDMGDSYRAYRRRTGEPVSAEVRGLADRFRREQDMTSLLAVAASLDALEVLAW